MSVRKAYKVDPADPMAPSADIWALLTEAERDEVVAALPVTVEDNFFTDGDLHADAVLESVEMIRARYGGSGGGGRSIYIGRSVMVYYPARAGLAPDLFVSFDVHDHPRDSYVVSKEGKGLDFALEVHWKGSATKDYRTNLTRYASVGIPEYFIFDLAKKQIAGFRLNNAGAYVPIMAQHGRYYSQVLDLVIARDGERFRFYVGPAALPTARETLEAMSRGIDEAFAAAAAADERAAAESERAESESVRAAAEFERAAAQSERAESEAARAGAEAERAEIEAARARIAEARVKELERLLEERSKQ